jgi:hypothetical protein
MVGRREVEGLLLKREKIFFLPSPFAPSDKRCFTFPRPESIRAGVEDMTKKGQTDMEQEVSEAARRELR